MCRRHQSKWTRCRASRQSRGRRRQSCQLPRTRGLSCLACMLHHLIRQALALAVHQCSRVRQACSSMGGILPPGGDVPAQQSGPPQHAPPQEQAPRPQAPPPQSAQLPPGGYGGNGMQMWPQMGAQLPARPPPSGPPPSWPPQVLPPSLPFHPAGNSGGAAGNAGSFGGAPPGIAAGVMQRTGPAGAPPLAKPPMASNQAAALLPPDVARGRGAPPPDQFGALGGQGGAEIGFGGGPGYAPPPGMGYRRF